ncbi:sedoheptulokinase isoform X1 [Alosa sapidissima]|uniref:sedoheptulokinase isoform X1 n=1 Tax=Alosa sapidissima TaxID=34773 RepID=UPI001C0950F6|nr:sedoheptulokinase isoform X1 [Alosa sapidissima]
MALSTCTSNYILGIDLGTTSVKVVLLDSLSRTVTESYCLPTRADKESNVTNAKEQDPERIINTLNQCVASLPGEKLQKVVGIGVSGQMHGVVFWRAKTGCEWFGTNNVRMFKPKDTSQLIIWQDSRCSSDFLSSLPQPNSHLTLATGFGCVTIFWLLKHKPGFLTEFNVAGTIHDYVVSMLCASKDCSISAQNAASWGYFNTVTHQWNLDINLCTSFSLREAGFPVHLLPEPVESGAFAGHTCSEWHGIPANTPVGVALGDLQCSVYSTMTNKTDAVLNISTSAQLTFAMPAGFAPDCVPDALSPIAYFPYFSGSYLAVAASLNGGNVMATFVGMLTSWIKDLGVEISETSIYPQLIQAAQDQLDTDLRVTPTVLGERHAATSLGQVSNISPWNLSLGHVTRALCRGILDNLVSMMPSHTLREAGVERIVASGSALARNEVIRQEVEKAFPLPVVYGKDVDSAVGVAMVCSDYLSRKR